MHPTLDVLENVILKAYDLDLYRHIGAANFSGKVYGEDSLRRMWSMSPASQIYYSILNPVFTALLPDLKLKNLQYPVVMFRDGIIDFIQYMIDNPHPIPKTLGYILDERLEPFLSESWYEAGFFYRLYYKPASAYQLPRERTRLVISTIANGSFVGIQTLESELLKAKKFASEKNLSIEFHIPVRENLFFDRHYQDKEVLFSLSELIFEILGTEIVFLSDKKISMDADYRDAYYHIPVDGALCISDNTLEHQLLTKGAAPMIAKAPVLEGELQVPLSTNHGIVVTRKERPKNCGQLFNRLVKEAVYIKETSSANVSKHQFPYFAKQLTYGDFFHYVKALGV